MKAHVRTARSHKEKCLRIFVNKASGGLCSKPNSWQKHGGDLFTKQFWLCKLVDYFICSGLSICKNLIQKSFMRSTKPKKQLHCCANKLKQQIFYKSQLHSWCRDLWQPSCGGHSIAIFISSFFLFSGQITWNDTLMNRNQSRDYANLLLYDRRRKPRRNCDDFFMKAEKFRTRSC